MKKILPFLLFALTIGFSVRAQVSTISPASANPGQSLTTTITLATGVMNSGSPPQSNVDIYLQQGAYQIFTDYFDETQVYPDGFGGYSDSLFTNFSIPANAPLGWYEIHVVTYTPWDPWFGQQPVDNMLDYGFVVADPNTCPVPSGVSTSNVTATTIDINWTDPTVADTFRIRYQPVGATTYQYLDVQGSGGLTSAPLSNLQPGTLYSYEIATRCNGYPSTYSIIDYFITDVAIVNCVRPFGLAITSVNNIDATIEWSPFLAADTFRIRYRPVGGSHFSYINHDGGLGNSELLDNLYPGTDYEVQVSSICNGVSSGYCPKEYFTTLSNPVSCVAPLGASAGSITATSAVISWSSLILADTFRVRYREFGALNYNYIDLDGATGDTSVSLTGLNPNTTYYYQVSSICGGVSYGYCSQSNFTTLNQTINCGRPFNVSVGSITTGSAVVSWDPLTVADTFRIRYSIDGTTNYSYIEHDGSGPNSETISNLLPNTTYQVRVSSICNGVSSGYCRPQVTFTTLNGPVSCVTPYGLGHSNVTGTTADISWTPLVQADSFMIRYSVNGTTNYRWKKITGAGGVTSTTLTGLSTSTDYQWQVRSICSGVTVSIYSASDVFTTAPVRLANPETVVASDWQLYPNPATRNVNLNVEATTAGTQTVRVTDLLGNTVITRNFPVESGNNQLQLDLAGLSPGVYFVTLIADNRELRGKRLIVN